MGEDKPVKVQIVWPVYLETFKGNTFYKSNFHVSAGSRTYPFLSNNKRLLVIRMIGAAVGRKLPETDVEAWHAGVYDRIAGGVMYVFDAEVPSGMVQLIEYLRTANVSITKKQLESLATYSALENWAKAYLPLMGNRRAGW